MNKNIIVVCGPKDSGKSTVLRMIVQQLRPFCDNRDNPSVPWPKQDFINSREPIKGADEIFHKLIISGKKVGLIGHGDYVKIIQEKFIELDVEWRSDYIVCCCRSKGSTRRYIEDTYGERILEWHTLPREIDFERRKQNEIDLATRIVDRILELSRIDEYKI